jgi:hypothetical protein
MLKFQICLRQNPLKKASIVLFEVIITLLKVQVLQWCQLIIFLIVIEDSMSP